MVPARRPGARLSSASVVAVLVIGDRGRAVALVIAALALVFWLWAMVVFVVAKAHRGSRPGRSGLLGFAVGGLAFVVVVVALLGHREGEATAWVVWAAFFLGLLLLYFLVDQKAWSPHGMYKGRLAATFSRVRAGDTTEPIKDTPLDELSEPAGHPQLLVCAAAYDTDHCPGEVQAWPFTFARDFVGGPDVGWCRTEDFQATLGNFNRSDATVQAAMAISGAAVSPGLGHIRFGSLDALIALANLRLGVWLPARAT